MKKQDAFSAYHPSVNFVYFASVFGFSMVFMHPVCLLISLACSSYYYIILKRKKAIGFLLKAVLPLLILTAVINPAFNHAGQTVICYLPSGNALTAESIVYGFAAGVMLTAVLLWFACYTQVMTTDKFIYLFGKIVPSLSLVLSMTLRFVPRFKTQFDSVKEAQSLLGNDMKNGGLISRIRAAITCFSITLTHSMENAIDTADSMKSRGYGTKKRTAYSIYKFEERDKYMLCFILFCDFFLVCGVLAGKLHWRYFPSIGGNLNEPFTAALQTVYFAVCILPVIIEKKEEKKWRSLRSKI